MDNWIKFLKTAFIAGLVVFIIGNWFFGDGFQAPVDELLISFAIYQLYAIVLSLVNILFFGYVGKHYNWEDHLKRRIIIGFFGSVTLTVLALIALRFVTMVLFFGGDPQTFLEHSKGYFLFGTSITIIFSLLFHLIYFYKAFSEQKVTESQVLAKTESAKYESLKSQLDPHFLFNSLNVLTSLIGENPALAEKFTTKLSKVYRYVLEQKNKDLITFDEELKFARTYMELLKMRFEDAIHFEIPERSSDPEYKIVPLSLQILLENAVKHNVLSSDDPLTIKIVEKEGSLIVENRIHKKSVLEKSTKVGLQNIKDRYALITKRPVYFEEKHGKFIVSLPLLTQKIKIMQTDKTEENKYYRARKKVEAIKEFYGSLISYFIVIPFLYIIWLKFTPFILQWFWFPALGWGIGLIFQGLKTFGNPLLGTDWEERKIREYMEKDKKQYWE